jgi:hypothetical protein
MLTPKKVVSTLRKLQAERTPVESLWQDIADYFHPNRNDIRTMQSEGLRRDEKIFDSTGPQALHTLAAALHGMLSNPAVQWFELTTGDDELDNKDHVRKWLQKTAQKIRTVLDASNFQTEIHEVYLDLCAFGMAGFDVEKDEKKLVRFRARHIRELYVVENAAGFIDQIYLSFKWTPAQLVEAFGADKVGEKIVKAYQESSTQKYEVVYHVYPTSLYRTRFAKFAPYASMWVLAEGCSGGDECAKLKEGHFDSFPTVVPRWTKIPGETYARSPAMNGLADTKMINEIMKTTLKGAQKAVDPPLQIPDDGFLNPKIDTRPSGLNYYRSGSGDRVEPFLNDTRVDLGFQLMQDVRTRIREALYVDQLQLLKFGPQMTATEVMQRTEEQMRLLGPMLGRQQVELLAPVIDRVFDILIEAGVINEAEIPEELRGRRVEVRYSSLVAKAQRMQEAQNIIRGMEAAANILAVFPEAKDNINGDYAITRILRIHGAPEDLINDKKAIQAIRDGRAKAQEQAIAASDEDRAANNIGKVGNVLVNNQRKAG